METKIKKGKNAKVSLAYPLSRWIPYHAYPMLLTYNFIKNDVDDVHVEG